MKKLSILVLLAVLLLNPGFGFAHGDDEGKGHDEMPGMAGMNDEGMQGMHEGMQKMHEENAATLKEAASLLNDTHPDVAAKLEKMAQRHESMKKS